MSLGLQHTPGDLVIMLVIIILALTLHALIDPEVTAWIWKKLDRDLWEWIERKFKNE